MSVMRSAFAALSVRNEICLANYFFCSARTQATTVSTDPNILRSETSDIVVPDLTLCELLYPKMDLYHKYIAAECATTGKSYTFGQIRMKSRNFSKALRKKLKLRKGDVVAILSDNVPEYWIAVFGILEAGLVVTTLNPAYTSEEIQKQLLDSEATVIITQDSTFGKVKSSLEKMNSRIPIMVIKEKQADSLPVDAINFHEFADSSIDIPDIKPGSTYDLALLPYSSGTTGMPKGVELTHNNIVANILQSNHQDFGFLNPSTDNFQDVVPGVLPLFHIYGLIVSAMNLAYNGGKMVTLKKFSPDLYVSALKNHSITVLFAAPPLILYLTTHKDVKKEYFKSTRMVFSGAAPLGFSDEERFIDKVGSHVQLRQVYGMTETAPLVTLFPKSAEHVGGSIGKLIPNTSIKIIAPDDPTGRHLGENESGELLVKGPQVMRGYHKKPEETKQTFLDGWFRTGDLARYDNEGFLYITDRLKELIKVKGFQVAPAELEEVIRNCPAVEDVAVIGVPHPTQGEVPRAFVVQKKGTTLNIEKLQEFVAEKVAKYKQLAGGVEIVDVIPKNLSGKILRRQLKQAYQEKNL